MLLEQKYAHAVNVGSLPKGVAGVNARSQSALLEASALDAGYSAAARRFFARASEFRRRYPSN